MQKLQAVRGTFDLFPDDTEKDLFIINAARSVAKKAGFGEISTPIFEFTDVFKRTLGDSSDIVYKEMYTFEDKSGNSLTLRPENTASVVRAFINAGLEQKLPCKFFYTGPMFRYERPQKGRQRQFQQIGMELFGHAQASAELDVILSAFMFLEEIGLKDHVTLELNTLGDQESRKAYVEALVLYFTAHKEKLSDDSKRRLQENPLRILDSKDEGDRALLVEAPKLHDYLNDVSKDMFKEVCSGLETLSIPYKINTQLVRGLDYYTHTVFEFTCDLLGAQNTVLAGGRYDGLVRQMGGGDVPAVGWAAGVERLRLLLPEQEKQQEAWVVVYLTPNEFTYALKVLHQMRQGDGVVHLSGGGSVKKQMKQASNLGRYCIMVGEDEMKDQTVSVKDMNEGTQQTIKLNDLPHLMKEKKERS